MITLTYGSVTKPLDERLIWTNEFNWSPVVIEARTATNGALHVHVGERLAGREITLDSRPGRAWLTRAECTAFEAWCAVMGAVLQLQLRGVQRSVMFDNRGGPGFAADPMWDLQDSEKTPDELLYPVFKFIEV